VSTSLISDGLTTPFASFRFGRRKVGLFPACRLDSASSTVFWPARRLGSIDLGTALLGREFGTATPDGALVVRPENGRAVVVVVKSSLTGEEGRARETCFSASTHPSKGSPPFGTSNPLRQLQDITGFPKSLTCEEHLVLSPHGFGLQGSS